MTVINTDSNGLEAFIENQNAVMTGDFMPGVLLDSFMLSCGNGYAAVYERPITTWTSGYRIEYEPGRADGVWDRWHARSEAA